MAKTLVLGEKDEATFLRRTREWLDGSMTKEEIEFAKIYRDLGFSPLYVAVRITKRRPGNNRVIETIHSTKEK